MAFPVKMLTNVPMLKKQCVQLTRNATTLLDRMSVSVEVATGLMGMELVLTLMNVLRPI